jgi:hypothetical protein
MTFQTKTTSRTPIASHAYSIPVVRELPAPSGLAFGSSSIW